MNCRWDHRTWVHNQLGLDLVFCLKSQPECSEGVKKVDLALRISAIYHNSKIQKSKYVGHAMRALEVFGHSITYTGQTSLKLAHHFGLSIKMVCHVIGSHFIQCVYIMPGMCLEPCLLPAAIFSYCMTQTCSTRSFFRWKRPQTLKQTVKVSRSIIL